ncbi:sporulation protein YqfD [Clostridium sp. DJ247]|nr:sporulation protein YqfD [Clostridium sp. DJ247]MBC2579305.1 sporulation protein YqfD [Clostridium sp. DJ247]
MSKINFTKYKSGIITIEIQSLIPEKFVNLMWKNDIRIKNIKKKNITTMTMEINLKDYSKIEDIAKKTKTKIKVVDRRGLAFFLIRLKKRVALAGGIILFVGVIYYLSTFIWGIEINVEHNLSPYEIRQQLNSFGIIPGINKKNINVYNIEEKLLKDNENILWVRVRVEGSKLKVSAAERQSPPTIVTEDAQRNLIAQKDGEVLRVYTKAGTAVVKKGDMVRKGQLLVKGEQGKEGSVYAVHAEGDVICRTFYEESKDVKINEIKRERTGNKVENIYIDIKGKKIYLKKSINKFNKYDKIEDNKLFIKRDFFYEVKETNTQKDPKKVVDDTANELYLKICGNLDKSVKIIDKIVNSEAGDVYTVRVLVVAEENIAIPEQVQETQR